MKVRRWRADMVLSEIVIREDRNDALIFKSTTKDGDFVELTLGLGDSDLSDKFQLGLKIDTWIGIK